MSRTIQAPGAAAETAEEKKLHCHRAHFGCGLDVPKGQYNERAMVCSDCANRVGQFFGLTYECANEALIQSLLPWYEGNETQPGKFPWLKNHTYRTKVRVLAFAAGSQGVRNLNQEEREMGMKIRAGLPELAKMALQALMVDPLRDAAERIERNMQQSGRMAAAGSW